MGAPAISGGAAGVAVPGPSARGPRPAHLRERGGITPLMAGICLVLGIFALGGFTLGRIAVARVGAQRAADAAALAATLVIKEEGLPWSAAKRVRAEAIARRNVGDGRVAYDWNMETRDEKLQFTVVATVELEDVPAVIFPNGTTRVSARARGGVSQQVLDEAERLLPRFLLILDYSGSMQSSLQGSSRTAIQVLESSVRAILNLALPIKWGCIRFSSNVIEPVVNVGEGNEERIRRLLDGRADGNTATEKAFDRAGRMFRSGPRTEERKYVLLVSDGAPNTPDRARNAGRALWNDDITVYTLHIDYYAAGSSASNQLKSFLVSVSGNKDAPADPSYYLRADNDAAVQRHFRTITAAIACQIKLADPPPPSGDVLRVFLRATGSGTGSANPSETRIRDVREDHGPDATRRTWEDPDNQASFEGKQYFWYNPPEKLIYVTPAVCDQILDGGKEVVARYGQPILTQ